jgi:demethoxyubiquinone hydroxylase (CLK1/Coq7/Cat5 family)
MHEKLEALPMVFNEEQKKTLQDLTGRIPILLSALTKIRLDNAEHESDAQDAQDAGEGSPLARSGDFTELLEKLRTSPRVILAERQISKFIHDQCRQLHNTPASLMYV